MLSPPWSQGDWGGRNGGQYAIHATVFSEPGEHAPDVEVDLADQTVVVGQRLAVLLSAHVRVLGLQLLKPRGIRNLSEVRGESQLRERVVPMRPIVRVGRT